MENEKVGSLNIGGRDIGSDNVNKKVDIRDVIYIAHKTIPFELTKISGR